jgi:aldehyde dehydrogenase (NAD+)
MPLVLAAHKFAPALAAGNAVLLKPSELTPYAILRVAELSAQAGLPHGIFAVLPGVGSETGAALVEHPLVSYLSFTGSTATGRAVMASAALSGPKPVSLELGGKTPQLVFADAPNLEGVAQTVASSITRNGGQICFAGTRLIVEESIADAFVEHVASLMSAVTAGPTWDPRTTLAPIISQKQADRVVEIVRAAKSDGAELVIGGEMFYANGGGIYFEPTILRNVAEGSTVLCDEVFGPVLTVQTFSDVDEGIRLADHPVYGLAAAVYTGNLDVALHAMRTIAAGTFWVNHFGPTDLASPIGGYKQSGFGKDYGAAAVDKYLKSKTVYVDMQQHIRKGSP